MAVYYASGKGIPSDHHALWIDIPLEALGWFTIPASVPLQAWRLQCKDPRIFKWYNMALQELIAQPSWLKDLKFAGGLV